MPRNSAGIYTLPVGNPVVAGTTIEAEWANLTMDDVADALTDSLSRSGEGGMLAPLPFDDGTVSAPGISWDAEPATGFYRAGSNDMRVSVAGVDKVRWTSTEVMEFYISSVWVSIEDIAGTGAVTVRNFTTNQTLALTDRETMLVLTGSTPRTVIIPPNSSIAFGTGHSVVIASRDTAAITIDPDTGVEISSVIAQNSTVSRTVPAGGTIVLTVVATDKWEISGDLI